MNFSRFVSYLYIVYGRSGAYCQPIPWDTRCRRNIFSCYHIFFWKILSYGSVTLVLLLRYSSFYSLNIIWSELVILIPIINKWIIQIRPSLRNWVVQTPFSSWNCHHHLLLPCTGQCLGPDLLPPFPHRVCMCHIVPIFFVPRSHLPHPFICSSNLCNCIAHCILLLSRSKGSIFSGIVIFCMCSRPGFWCWVSCRRSAWSSGCSWCSSPWSFPR